MRDYTNTEDVQRLERAFARVRAEAPDEFRSLMRSGAERYILPPAKAATPVLTGRLRDATRVVPTQYGVKLVNTAARGPRGRWTTNRYGNSIHWGRRTNPSQKSPLSPKFDNVIKGTRFIHRYMEGESRPQTFDDHLHNGLVRVMERDL